MSSVDHTAIGWALRASPVERIVERIARRPLLDRLAAAFVALSILAIAAYAWVRPDYNWDMVAYVATALEDRHADPVSLHAETWRVIGEGASESQLYHLKFSNPYNLNQWEKPADFQSQLSMYRVKVAYIGLLRLIEPVTGLAAGAILLSILPALGLGLLLLVWLRSENALQAGFVAIPALIIADYSHMTTAVTPDMLVGLTSLAAIYCLSRGRDGFAAALLLASVLIRPDTLILIFALTIAAWLFGWRKLPMTATFAAAFVLCMAISKIEGHPGWWAHFYFSCVTIQNSMADFHPPFALADFVKGYVRGVVVSLMDNDWPMLLAILVAAWALLSKAGKTAAGRTNALVFALVIGTLGKFASFPLPDDRFYFTFIAGLIIVLAAAWKPRFEIGAARVGNAA